MFNYFIMFLFPLSIFLGGVTNLKQEDPDPFRESIKRGEKIYTAYCVSCHQQEGEGIEGVFPPLAKSDYLMKNKKRSIRQIVNGVRGKIIVNGVEYDGEMSPQGLSDQQTADVLNYIRNSWKNKGDIVTKEEVEAER